MLKVDYIVYILIYINISWICKNNTANHLNIGQNLFWLTLRVNPWLINLNLIV